MDLLQLHNGTAETLRLVVFFALLAILSLVQWKVPWRSLSVHRLRDQANNLVLVLLGNLLIRLAVPFSLLWVAQSDWNGFGLLQQLPPLPCWLKVVIGLVLLDGAVYWQHRLTHAIPILWRLHRVHHSDSMMEVTTAVRFHPLELLLSTLLKIALVLVLGVDVLTVLLFEMLLSGFALWGHTNVQLPKGIDKWLRLLIVTPDMHRIHHSHISVEHNSNYGFCLSVWDRLFASYTVDSRRGRADVVTGLDNLAGNGLLSLLIMPFLSKARSR